MNDPDILAIVKKYQIGAEMLIEAITKIMAETGDDGARLHRIRAILLDARHQLNAALTQGS